MLFLGWKHITVDAFIFRSLQKINPPPEFFVRVLHLKTSNWTYCYRGFSHTWPNPRDCWGGSILGVKLCNSCSGSGRYDIETTCATLVKESRNVQTKYRSGGSTYPCTLLVILFYIINMHGLTRICPTQSLLGYTDIVNLSYTLSSTEVIWLTCPWTHLKGIIDVTCCWMGSWCTCKRGIIMAK